MKKLYDKSEVTFAVVLIVIYVVGMSLLQSVSEMVGIEYFAEIFFAAAFAVVLFVFIKKNGLTEHIGLCRPEVPAGKMLFYIPPVLIASLGAIFGVGLQYPVPSLICHTVTMLFVGFIEEVLFRGFLFRGMAKTNLTAAVIVSSLTFGIGHIVNLLNGYSIFDSVTQIIYAVSVGFMLAVILIRSGSLIPCIVFHSLNNILTGFASGKILVDAAGSEETAEIIVIAAGLVIAVLYMLYVLKFTPKREIKA